MLLLQQDGWELGFPGHEQSIVLRSFHSNKRIGRYRLSGQTHSQAAEQEKGVLELGEEKEVHRDNKQDGAN